MRPSIGLPVSTQSGPRRGFAGQIGLDSLSLHNSDGDKESRELRSAAKPHKYTQQQMSSLNSWLRGQGLVGLFYFFANAQFSLL